MSSTIVKRSTDLSISNVVFSELKKQGKGGHLSFVNYKDSTTGKTQRLIIQLPKMFAPFGASCFKQDGPTDQLPKYNVTMALDETAKGVSALKAFMTKLDKLVCKKALKNKEWKKQLSKKLNEAMLEAFYTPVVRASSNEKYPDSMNLKVPINWTTSEPALQLYGKNKDKLDLTFDNIEQLLPKLSELKGLVQVSHVWFVSKKFGVTLKLLQGMVYPKETLTGYSLADDSDSEEEDEEVVEDESEDEEEVELESSDDEE